MVNSVLVPTLILEFFLFFSEILVIFFGGVVVFFLNRLFCLFVCFVDSLYFEYFLSLSKIPFLSFLVSFLLLFSSSSLIKSEIKRNHCPQHISV